jgi:hypothetical protein
MLQRFDQNDGFGREECCNSWCGSLYAQRAEDCFVLLNMAKQSPKQTYTGKKDASTWAREEKRKSLDKKVTSMLKHDYQSGNKTEDGNLSVSTTITVVPPSLGKCPAVSPGPYLVPAD